MVHNDTFKGFFLTPISLIEYYEIINIIINQKTKNQFSGVPHTVLLR